MAYKTNLGGSNAKFHDMMSVNGFGIVTVMNADIYEALTAEEYASKTAYQIVKAAEALKTSKDTKYICTLDTLKIANVTEEGPTKTITGGRYSNPLIKFGKSARLEMQDALGNAQAIEALCGAVQEWDETTIQGEGEAPATTTKELVGLHFGEDFVGPKMIIGDTFFMDRKSGQQVKVKVVFYQFLPDSIFNLTQDAEGDATVFDMNGDLLTTEIKVANAPDGVHGLFYSIVDPNHNPAQ